MNFNPHKLGLAAAAGYLVTLVVNILFVIIVGGGSMPLITSQLGSMLLLQLVTGYILGYVVALTYNKLT